MVPASLSLLSNVLRSCDPYGRKISRKYGEYIYLIVCNPQYYPPSPF